MLKGFGGASTAHGINGGMTSLCLVGGVDCTPGSTPDLVIKGGARIKKSLCVLGKAKIETLDVKSDTIIGGNISIGGDELITGDQVVMGNAAICGNVYLKENVHILGNLFVDNINENTLNHGVMIEGVLLKDGMISVPTPGIAACIQDPDLNTTVCVDVIGEPDTITMTVKGIKKIHLHTNGGWEHGNIVGINVVSAPGEDAFASGQGTQNIVTLLGKTDIDGRTGVINLLASGKGAHAEGGATVASGDYSHTEGVGTQAVGVGSHAEGIGSKATGLGAHAEGDPTLASGNYSHAEGVNTTASGFASHSAGQNATAGPANNTYAWSDGTVFTNNTAGRYAIRAGGQVLIDNGALINAVTKTYNSQTSWSYTPSTPSNWPMGLDNVAYALDSISSGAAVLMGPTDVTGTANNNKVVSFQNGISLNGTIISRNVGVGVGTLSGITSGVDNTIIGSGAGSTIQSGSKNVVVGRGANTSAATSNGVCVGEGSFVLGTGNLVLGQGSTDNAQSNVIVLGSGVTAGAITSGNQLAIGSGITPLVGFVTITNYIRINIGGTVYKLPIGV